MRRLILLTNEYPFDAGDAAFVGREISALTEAFDEVHVFNCARREAPSIEMPPGVYYHGNLFPSRRSAIARAALSPRAVLIARRAWRRERRQGVPRSRLRAFVAACLRGMRMAADPRVQRLLAQGTNVTVYAYWGLGAGLALPWLADRADRSFVRVHRYDLYESPGYLPFRAQLYSSVDAVLAVSDHAREYIAQRHPMAHVVVSRLGTNDPGVRPDPPSTTRTPLIVSCSHVIPVKRVELILDSIAAMGGRDDVRWIHFGGGVELPELSARVRSAGIDADLRGQTPHDEVLDFYASEYVDAFVNLSESEGVPVSIMEAMSFDIPIVATDVGGTGEIVTDEAGRLVAANPSAAEVAKVLRSVLEHRGSFRSREVWSRLCDANVNSRRTAQLLLGHPAMSDGPQVDH